MPAAIAQDLLGRVVGISDGDTLTLLVNGREEVWIRLSEIDTPERGQPYGTRARDHAQAIATCSRSPHCRACDALRYLINCRSPLPPQEKRMRVLGEDDGDTADPTLAEARSVPDASPEHALKDGLALL